MSEPQPPTETQSAFERWLHGVHSPAHARRTAERNAAFFLPHLKPGMCLLDVGCGPGSITIGLARAIAPGDAIGIDANTDAIDAARELAAQRSCANVRFETADVYALPFEDGSFDAVFCHAVMQHLRDPLAALRETRRVMRTGGVIGLADADWDGTLLAPADPLLDASLGLLADVRERSGGGDPRVGKRLRGLLHEAGFARAKASVAADADGSDEATRRTGEFWARYFESPELIDHAGALELASREEMASMAEAWRRWGADPSAFWARFWCQAVGWKE